MRTLQQKLQAISALTRFARCAVSATVLAVSAFSIAPTARAGEAPAAAIDTDPESERKAFQVVDGFEVTLFASDPMIAKPISMNFDAQGRLWVASSSIYPQLKPGEAPNDKI